MQITKLALEDLSKQRKLDRIKEFKNAYLSSKEEYFLC